MSIPLIQHLTLERHLQIERYSSVALNEEEGVATFFIWNLSGQLVGYHQYRAGAPKTQRNDPKDGRYYTYLTKSDGKFPAIGVWGLETYNYKRDVLCFTEGVFDACRLHNLGIPAVAVFSNNPKHLRPWFAVVDKKKIGFRDNDIAGMAFEKFFDECRVMTEKDLGDSTDEEIFNIVGDLIG